MESDQIDQVHKILRMDLKDFPCSSKRNLLCPADDFLSRPEIRENPKKITIEKNQDTVFKNFRT